MPVNLALQKGEAPVGVDALVAQRRRRRLRLAHLLLLRRRLRLERGDDGADAALEVGHARLRRRRRLAQESRLLARLLPRVLLAVANRPLCVDELRPRHAERLPQPQLLVLVPAAADVRLELHRFEAHLQPLAPVLLAGVSHLDRRETLELLARTLQLGALAAPPLALRIHRAVALLPLDLERDACRAQLRSHLGDQPLLLCHDPRLGLARALTRRLRRLLRLHQPPLVPAALLGDRRLRRREPHRLRLPRRLGDGDGLAQPLLVRRRRRPLLLDHRLRLARARLD